MAVNVNTVYRTVLLILNKEQRGYMTPDEFNQIATQVQLEIFNKYFDDLNQLIRVPQTDLDYADRVKLLDEKIAIFKTTAGPSDILANGFVPPANMRELGSVIYNGAEIQRVQRSEFYNLNRSKLTKPSTTYPVYLYENNLVKVYPETITTGVSFNYLRQLVSPKWAFVSSQINNYKYEYDSGTSLPFDLHESEQTNIIIRILMYSGIIVQSPEIVQVAAQKVQQDNMNEKQ